MAAGQSLPPPLRAAPVLVAVLCALPWLNPVAFGPVPSVLPWLASAAAVAAALLLCQWGAPPAAARPAVAGGWGWCVLPVLLLCAVAFPRAAAPPPYEALALAGALALVGLGAALVRRHPAGSQVAGLPWPWWCALLPWLLAGLASSVLALLQYFGLADALVPWVSWAPLGEAFANLRQRNQFASLTSIALAVLLAAWLLPARGLPRRDWPAWAMAAALLVAGNAASASRTGLLQLLVLAVLALLWRRDRRVWLALGGLFGVYAVAAFALPWAAGLDPAGHGMFSRLRSGDALCASRLTLWRNVLQLIAARPWLGWGWGELDYAHYVTLYDGPRFCDILDNAHSLPLHLAVELGVPVAVLFCGAVLVWVLRGRPWRETDPVRRTAWMVLAVVGVHSLLEYPLWYGPFQLALGLCLGLLAPARPAAPGGGRAAPVALAAAMLGAVAYAGWDYHRIGQIYLPPELRAPAYRADTLAKLQHSWLFRRQVLFAELGVTESTPQNAAAQYALATELLHFSPEPRVVERLLDSARQLGLDDEVAFHAARLRAAFPEAYLAWLSAASSDR
ncbi:PglL family O-oligosaccharyltransferase [Pseudorhodoferax sp.]|uniref:PglL family O-oligosaccharyltransferase n=1 Tax=Pseudorhodoferax sp. TaxID=1993553 RepID=UPI0039E689E5